MDRLYYSIPGYPPIPQRFVERPRWQDASCHLGCIIASSGSLDAPHRLSPLTGLVGPGKTASSQLPLLLMTTNLFSSGVWQRACVKRQISPPSLRRREERTSKKEGFHSCCKRSLLVRFKDSLAGAALFLLVPARLLPARL